MAHNTALEAPHSKESEMMVLGCILNNHENFKHAAERLESPHFYMVQHRPIFEVIKTFHAEGKKADTHLVAEELKTLGKLETAGGVNYIIHLAQYAGVSANIEEYCEHLEKFKTQRDKLNALNSAFINLQKNPHDHEQITGKLEEDIILIKSSGEVKIPLKSISERLSKEDEFLKAHRGKTLIGLGVKTIKEFNEHMLGLRGLQLIAAAPNVGKTALTIQLALEVLETEPEACVVYVSLEMTEMEIFRRMILNLSGVNFKDLVLGTEKQQKIHSNGTPSFVNEDITKNEAEARKTLERFGDRLQIIDQTTCPNINAGTIIKHVERIKRETTSKRVMIIVDYLQVWPTRDSGRFSNEIELDKWRIGEMKKIRDAINNDPILVISEARKPGQKEDEWGGDLSDVMGSARGTYTPDAVMLFSQLQPKAIKALWNSYKLPQVKITEEKNKDEESEGKTIISFLSTLGISICRLRLAKCRDGMTRFSTDVSFFFKKNQFAPVPWTYIEAQIKKSQKG